MNVKLNDDLVKQLPEELKVFVKSGPDGHSFVLEQEDTGALKRAKDREKEEARRLSEELSQAKQREQALAAEKEALIKARIPKEDAAALEAALQTKFATEKVALEGKLDSLQRYLHKSLVENAASRVASELFAPDAVELGSESIKTRFRVAQTPDGQFVTEFLDEDGKTPISEEIFKKSLTNSKKYANIVNRTKAKGIGDSSAFAGSALQKKLDPTTMTPAERIEYAKAMAKRKS